jgi:hypothetical protein
VGEEEAKETDKKAMLSVNWLLHDKELDVQTGLALGFLNFLLVGTSAAPLQKALTDSDLGSSVIGGGLSSELLQVRKTLSALLLCSVAVYPSSALYIS